MRQFVVSSMCCAICALLLSSFGTGEKNKKGAKPVPVPTAVVSSVAASKKYEIKSGIVTFETVITMGSMKILGKKVLTFDDYGMKECEETYKDNVLTESFVCDGVERFKLYHEGKLLVKAGKAFRGTAMRFDWSEVSQKDKDAGTAKQGAHVTVAGKECETFTYLTNMAGSSNSTEYAGWKHIVLSTVLTSKSMTNSVVAVSVEENATVPASKFKAPSDYTVQ